MRFLLDTNVWLSSLWFGGVCREVVELASARGTVVVSEALNSEVLVKLEQKFRATPEDLVSAERGLRNGTEVVEMPPPPYPRACRDPKDDFIVALAIVGACNLVITGDGDLRVLETIGSARVVTPRQFKDACGV